MGVEMFISILMILFYVLCGVSAKEIIYTDIRKEINPLWKIPLILLGPFSFIIYMIIVVYKTIKSYIKEVKDYYKRNAERKRIEKRRRMRELE